MPEHSGHDFMDEAALDAIEDGDVASAGDPQDLSDEQDQGPIERDDVVLDSKPESALVPNSPGPEDDGE